MSLVKSDQIFGAMNYPIMVDFVENVSWCGTDFHRHDFYEMIFVEQGTLVHRFKGNKVVLNAGDILIIKPYVPHAVDPEGSAAGTTAYFCSFLPQIIDSSIQSLEELFTSHSPNRYFFTPFKGLSNKGVYAIRMNVEHKKQHMLNQLFEELNDRVPHGTEGSQAIARARFLKVLITLAEECEQSRILDDAATIVRIVPQ